MSNNTSEELPATEKPAPASRNYLPGLRLLLPWFLQRSPTGHKRLRKTANLDGLRGFAAFLVLIQHHHTDSHPLSPRELAFGHDGNYYFVAFPFVRTFFDGGTWAVCIFFILSGYVLSLKPLTLRHAGQHDRLGASVASALFRRWARLFIPLIVTTWWFVTFCWAFGVWNPIWEPKGSYLEEMQHWSATTRLFTYIFGITFSPMNPYNPHLWTIPTEFKGSIVVYTTVLAVSRLTRAARLATYGLLLVYFWYMVDGWYCSFFLTGMVLCDFDVMIGHDAAPAWVGRLEPKRYKQLAWTGLFIVGMAIGSMPTKEDWAQLPFYGWIAIFASSVTGKNWFILWWASIIIVLAAQRLKWFKRFLETRFCQYLGRISYSLYLVHGPVLWTLGWRIYSLFGCLGTYHHEEMPWWSERFVLPDWGIYGFEVRYFAAELIMIPFTFWVAELCTTLVDEASVNIMQKLYSMGVQNEEQ